MSRTYQDYLEEVREHGGQPMTESEFEDLLEAEAQELEMKGRK